VHPLHENEALVEYLRQGIRDGRFEAMLHGYHHDEPDGSREFAAGSDLRRKVAHGRQYLEAVLSTTVRVFVPPHNAIRREGLRAVAAEGLHLAGTAGFRSGWPLHSPRSWVVWLELKRGARGRPNAPQILDLGDHREIPGQAVTPSSSTRRNQELLEQAIATGGAFCAATHYWEFDVSGPARGEPTVAEQLRQLVHRVAGEPSARWRTVGDVVSDGARRT
jgi:peptidoglycan/xylan/chitin deacetylase (PgdA/CDA1 family)